MKKILVMTILLYSQINFAAPYVLSDPTLQTVTHCGIYMDSNQKIEIPVTSGNSGKYCKYDLIGITSGGHSVKATFINKDPVWGIIESVFSNPLEFTKPGLTVEPTGLVIVP